MPSYTGPGGINSDPAAAAYAVTPSDSNNFTNGECRALYVGTTGNIVAVVAGNTVTFNAVPVGILPVRCTRVNATSTTASNIVALY